MFEAVGLPVSRLIRIQYGELTLPPRLRPGKWMMLSAEETAALAASLGLATARPTPSRPMPRRAAPKVGKPAPRRAVAKPAGERKTYSVREGKAVFESSTPAPKPPASRAAERARPRRPAPRKRP